MIVRMFLTAPFQVISAAEFIAASDLEDARFDPVLLQGPSRASSRQAMDTARQLGLSMRLLEDHPPTGFFDKLKRLGDLRNEVAELTETDVIVIGDPSSDLLADALARAACRDKWVVDDGVVSLRYLDAVAGVDEFSWSGKPSTWLSRRLTRTPDWRQVNWFTIFANDVPPSGRIHHNSLQSLRERSRLGSPGRTILFLGSPLVTAGMYSSDTYTELCRQCAESLRKQYEGCEVVYLCHRSETSSELPAQQWFDDVQQSTGPIELRWLGSDEASPRAVAGILSTALFTLRELLPPGVGVHAFWPPDNCKVLEAYRDPSALKPVFDRASAQQRIQFQELEPFDLP